MFVLVLISNCILLFSSAFGFILGVVKYFKKRKPLFPTLVTCGIGCLMLSHLFHIVILFTEESITPGFNVGKLGLIGGFLFFFSASFGQMDGLVDNRSKEFLKYRLIALAAPRCYFNFMRTFFYIQLADFFTNHKRYHLRNYCYERIL